MIHNHNEIYNPLITLNINMIKTIKIDIGIYERLLIAIKSNFRMNYTKGIEI